MTSLWLFFLAVGIAYVVWSRWPEKKYEQGETTREFFRAMYPEPPYEGSEELGDSLFGPDSPRMEAPRTSIPDSRQDIVGGPGWLNRSMLRR